MKTSDNLLDEFEELFGGGKEAKNTDPEINKTLETTSKEVEQVEKETAEESTPGETSAEQLGLFPESPCGAKKTKNKKVKKNTSCTPVKPKEPDKDMERFVVLTNYNEQKSFPAEMTLEEIRVELEKEYPAYSKENTSWYFEKQENRYMCIPNYKSNKAG